MDIQKIQKLIDAEKPAFEYARMFLTTVAWWALVIIIIKSITDNEKSHALGYAMMAPTLIVAVIFGVILSFRLNILTERISKTILDGFSSYNRIVRIPVKLFAFLLPVSSAWMVVWALMFARAA